MKPKPPEGRVVGFRTQPGQSAHSSVKPGSYFDLAAAHMQAHGGKGFVIDRNKGDQRQQWRAWMAYFAWLDGQDGGHKAKTLAKLDRITTPSAWPLEFDASAPPAPVPEQPPPPVSLERRRALAAMLRDAVRSTSADPDWRPKPPPHSRDASPQNWDERLAALQADYAANPVSFSRPIAKDDPGEASAS